MKFQDEGPKLRQRYETSVSTEPDRQTKEGGSPDYWPDSSSEASSESSHRLLTSNFNAWDETGLVVSDSGRHVSGFIEGNDYLGPSQEIADYFFAGGGPDDGGFHNSSLVRFHDPYDRA